MTTATTLVSNDRERVELLLRRAVNAMNIATSPTVSVQDVLEEYDDDALLVDDDLAGT